MNQLLRPRRLPLKVLSHGLELSAESENLLEEAMARLNLDDPDDLPSSGIWAASGGRSQQLLPPATPCREMSQKPGSNLWW